MKFLLDELGTREPGAQSVYALSTLQRAYRCQCGRAVFFANSQCLSCGRPLGYEPRLGRVFSLAPGSERDLWQVANLSAHKGDAGFYRRCANLNTTAACNWLVEQATPGAQAQPYCASCRLNRTIPDLSLSENAVLWGRIENAKRRVISALLALGLPVASRVSEDPQRGLSFDFLQSPPNGPRVLTGHNDGLITVNIDEADDLKREAIRTSMHELYRTLVGHLRHEVGHYYWDRLVANSPWIDGFRSLFGDERADYSAALQKNYAEGPALNWPEHYVSAYASAHPWEDWAETWAHYMHMVDTLGTAMSFGLKPDSIAMPFDGFGPEALYQSDEVASERFLLFLNAWLKLTAVLNELCRSMGQTDFYPFALPRTAVTKLHFIHVVIRDANSRTERD